MATRSGRERSAVSRSQPRKLEAGSMVGRYRLVERIGGGGMGVVYRAEDPLLGREVAIKVAHSEGPLERELFLAEARHAASATHPNLVSVFDLGIDQDIGFIAMELVTGTPLAQLIRRGPSDVMVAAAIGVGIASGLAALHDAKLVHRDVKPANIMLCVSGVVKVLDFGVATLEGGAGGTGIAGTPGYIAPELILGEHPRRAADVFALGVVLFELVVGHRLFEGESAIDRIIAVTQGAAPRLPAGRAPAWFADLVAACLLRDPAERPAHASEVVTVLRAREPYADLASLARDLRSADGDTIAHEMIDEAADATLVRTPLVGRDVIVARLASQRACTCWLHGPGGSGKTRLVSELALRRDVGAVLIVEGASSVDALAGALGVDGADVPMVRSAIRELAPVLVALEDVSSDRAAWSLLVQLVREEAPDALCLVTSEHLPPGVDRATFEIVEVLPFTLPEAELFLAARVRTARWSLARTLAPLANGHPLSLELLALGIERADQSLDGIRRGDALVALVDRALASLTTAARRVAELLSVASDRGVALLRAEMGDAVELALEELLAYGFLERREHDLALHRAVRGVISELLAREGRDHEARRELTATLVRVLARLDVERHGPSAAAAFRTLLLLRSELVLASERALIAPTVHELTLLLDGIHMMLDSHQKHFGAALPLLGRFIEALTALGAHDDVLATAHLARARGDDRDLASSGRDADVAIQRSSGSARIRADALAMQGSVSKRRGQFAEALALYQSVAEIAAREGFGDLGTLAHWEIVLLAARAGQPLPPDYDTARAATSPDASLPPALRPRISMLRALVALELGDARGVIAGCELALAGARELGQVRFVAWALSILVETHLWQGELALAETAARQALLVGRATNLPLPLGSSLHQIAIIAMMRGEWSTALRFARESQAAFEGGDVTPSVVARGRAILACCLALVGEEGVHPSIDEALARAKGLPPALVTTVELYVAFARWIAGEPDALDVLEGLLTTQREGTGRASRSELASTARVIESARKHVRVRGGTLPGPLSD